MKKLLATLLTLSLMLAMLASCGTDTTAEVEEEPETPAELTSITITEPSRVYQWYPVYLAETLGYFEEEGLDVEFITVSGTDAAVPVFAGEAQFGLRGIEMALAAEEAGQGVKIIASTSTYMPYDLIGASEDYATVESLKGQTVAGGMGATSAPQVFAKAILMDEGLTPNEDVAVIDMVSAGYLAAIEAGSIQAAVGTTPWATKMLLDQGGVIISTGSDGDAMEALLGSANYELFMIFATDEYIASNPEEVQSAANAIAKALLWAETATPEEIATNLLPLFEDRYEELLYCAELDKETGMCATKGYHTDDGYAAAVALTLLSGTITGDIDANEVYDESFLDNAWAMLEE